MIASDIFRCHVKGLKVLVHVLSGDSLKDSVIVLFTFRSRLKGCYGICFLYYLFLIYTTFADVPNCSLTIFEGNMFGPPTCDAKMAILSRLFVAYPFECEVQKSNSESHQTGLFILGLEILPDLIPQLINVPP